MISWYYMLIAAGLLIVFLLYKEWTRKNKIRLYSRLIASVIAVISLVCMAYTGTKNNDTAAVKKVIVLTDGFVKDSLDNFLKQNNKKIPIFSTIHRGGYSYAANPSQPVTDWAVFAEKYKEDTLHIFGNGCNNEMLTLLNQHPIVFHATPQVPAITHIYWNQSLQPGGALMLQGSYENVSAQKIKIILQSFGKDKDSVIINAHSNQDFVLRSIPVHAGRSVFALIAMAGSDTLQNEPIPVEVEPSAPLQLLIISSSPDFENTYLKNHLSQKGYQVTVTTAISSNKTDKQFLNTPLQQAGRLTSSYLNKFDVLMADEEALQKMSGAELAAVRSAVQDNGTGLLIQLDAEKSKAAFYSKFFTVKKLQQAKQSYIFLSEAVADSNKYKISITDPTVINCQPGTQILLQDAQSAVYAAGAIDGSGKIVATTLQNTYSIALAGDIASYEQLWWLLLHKTAKKIVTDENWQKNPFIPFVNDPVLLQAEKNDTGLSQATLHQTNIYLKQNVLLPFQWKGMYWPAVNGWQPFPRLHTATGAWYVYKTGDWEKLSDYNRLTATKKYAVLHPVSFKALSNSPATAFMVNNPLFLLIIFLLSCVFLWVEQKRG